MKINNWLYAIILFLLTIILGPFSFLILFGNEWLKVKKGYETTILNDTTGLMSMLIALGMGVWMFLLTSYMYGF